MHLQWLMLTPIHYVSGYRHVHPHVTALTQFAQNSNVRSVLSLYVSIMLVDIYI